MTKTGRKPTDLPVEKIVALHRAGWSKAAIARYFDVAPSTISERLRSVVSTPESPDCRRQPEDR